MNSEMAFQIAFWWLLGLMVLMHLWFVFRVRQAGDRLMPDKAAIKREGWSVVFIGIFGKLLLVALIVLVPLHRVNLQRFAFPLPFWLRWVGLALGLASLGLWTWTHVALGRFWSVPLQLRADHRLVTSGPYSRVRHPMYAAALGWVVSLGLVVANWVPLIFAAWVAILVLMRVPREEQMMVERFGDEYREYMKRTGRFFPL
jgi:protein-S-isoprenylcysteine O-methyltransferase Ste14